MMNVRFEIEYKTLITPNQATKLLRLGIFTYKTHQINDYFDSDDYYFSRQKSVLRIRTRNQRHIFTQKTETDAGLVETEFDIDSHNMNDVKIKELMQTHQRPFTWITSGQSETTRYIYDDQFGQWCLDFNTFDFICDIELEYELFEGVNDKKEHFLDQLKKWDIPHFPCQSKFKRMLDYHELHQDDTMISKP